MFLEISQNLPENTCWKVSFLIKLQAVSTASDFSRVFSYWRFLVYFISTEKWNKVNTLMDLKYLLFYSSIDLFEVKDFKRNLTDDILIRKWVSREFNVAIFKVRWISLGQSFWVLKTWRAPEQKRVKRSTLNLTHTFLTECWTNSCPCFL